MLVGRGRLVAFIVLNHGHSLFIPGRSIWLGWVWGRINRVSVLGDGWRLRLTTAMSWLSGGEAVRRDQVVEGRGVQRRSLGRSLKGSLGEWVA